jgi:hypothetical protein
MENAFVLTRGNLSEKPTSTGLPAECQAPTLFVSRGKHILARTPCIFGKAFAIATYAGLRTGIRTRIRYQLRNSATGQNIPRAQTSNTNKMPLDC